MRTAQRAALVAATAITAGLVMTPTATAADFGPKTTTSGEYWYDDSEDRFCVRAWKEYPGIPELDRFSISARLIPSDPSRGPEPVITATDGRTVCTTALKYAYEDTPYTAKVAALGQSVTRTEFYS